MSKAAHRLVKTWRRRSVYYRIQSRNNFQAGMPANRMLGRAEGIEMCCRELEELSVDRLQV